LHRYADCERRADLLRRCLLAPQPLPTFGVTSGPCTVTEGGACFRTPNYPDHYEAPYGTPTDCEIAVSGAGFVRATAFDTESGRDYLNIGGTLYDGDGGALASSGVPVGDGTTVAWRVAPHSSDRRSGAEVCGASCDEETCGPHGSCGSDGATCACADGWSGDACNVRQLSVVRCVPFSVDIFFSLSFPFP